MDLKTFKRRPEGLEESGPHASNCSSPGQIDDGTEEALRSGKTYAQHAAWDYCGYVWWDAEDKKFHEEIWRYGTHVATLSDDTLQGVVDQACAKYGSE